MEAPKIIEVVNNELARRIEQNRKYSLRQFAKELEMAPSLLSDFLREKKKISSSRLEEVLKKIPHLAAKERTSLLLEYTSLSARSHSERTYAGAKKKAMEGHEFRSIPHYQENFYQHWQVFALCSAMELDDFDGTAAFLAKKLYLNEFEVNHLLRGLKKDEVVEVLPSGLLRFNGKKLALNLAGKSNLAARERLKKSVEQGLQALEKISPEDRDFSTVTMSIDRSKLPEARERIKKFRRELMVFLEEGCKNEVFELSIALFPLKGPHSIEQREEEK
jgi:uncharacterized protein (TIGR02147 family)